MKENYLGDSYDIVKRFWADVLRPIAKLYVHPSFIPDSIKERFALVTRMPLYQASVSEAGRPFGIFLDPDTGIALPSARHQRTSIAHASLDFIVRLYQEVKPEYLVCFDQSFKRGKAQSKREEMKVKCDAIEKRGYESFYFDSHASFLFVSHNAHTLVGIEKAISEAGIPSNRLYAKISHDLGTK